MTKHFVAAPFPCPTLALRLCPFHLSGFRISLPYLRVMSAYHTELWNNRSTGLL